MNFSLDLSVASVLRCGHTVAIVAMSVDISDKFHLFSRLPRLRALCSLMAAR